VRAAGHNAEAGDLQDHGAQVAGQVAEGLAQRNALSPGRSPGGGEGHTKD